MIAMPAPTTARTLLDTAVCTPLCLLAASPARGCTCRCGGHHHGQLLDIVLEAGESTRAAA